MRGSRVAILAMVGLVLAPAVSAAAGGQTAAFKNACVLVTTKDASEAIYGVIGSTKHTTGGGFGSCTHTGGGTKIVIRTRPLSQAGFTRSVALLKGPVVAATNVGSAAWVSFIDDGISLIAWQKGNELIVKVTGNPSNAPTIAQSLAAIA